MTSWLKRHAHLIFWSSSLALILVIIILCVFPTQSSDVFMYLALGREYFRTGVIPETDPFMFTLPHHHWEIMQAWGSYIIYYGLFILGGWPLLAIFKTLWVLTPFGLALRMAKRHNSASPLIIVLALLTVFASYMRFTERTSLFSDVFLSIVTARLIYRETQPKHLIWQMPLLFAIWVNLHPGYPAGLIILVIALASDWKTRHSTNYRFLLTATALSALACLLNPKGLEGALTPFRLLSGQSQQWAQYISEFLPTYHPYYRYNIDTAVFVALGTMTLLLLWAARKTHPWFHFWCFLFLVALGVRSVRYLETAAFSLLMLSTSMVIRGKVFEKGVQSYLCSAGVIFFLLWYGDKVLTEGCHVEGMDRHLGFGIDYQVFPKEALDFIDNMKIKAPLFNAYGMGCYLAWHWDGKRQLYIHGFVNDFEFFRDNYVGIVQSREKFDSIVNKYKIGAFLLTKIYGDTPLDRILNVHPVWQRVFEDQASIVYLKKDPSVVEH